MCLGVRVFLPHNLIAVFFSDQVFDEFLIAYAKAEDKIRATWTKIIAAHAPFTVTSCCSLIIMKILVSLISQACIREHLAAEIQQEKEREDQQLLGIAYHKKSDECAFRDFFCRSSCSHEDCLPMQLSTT